MMIAHGVSTAAKYSGMFGALYYRNMQLAPLDLAEKFWSPGTLEPEGTPEL